MSKAIVGPMRQFLVLLTGASRIADQGFIDETLRWVGDETYAEFYLHENGRQGCCL